MTGPVTQLLRRWAAGDRGAESELFSEVYKELRRMAAHFMQLEQAGHTLQPTALVHEVYVRVLGSGPAQLQDRQHFMAVASRAMRHVLVDHARSRQANKRGGNARHVTLDGSQAFADASVPEVLAVHQALDRLTAIEPRQSQIVEMRYFAGFSLDEIADALGVSSRTVKRDWALARQWLYREIVGAPS